MLCHSDFVCACVLPLVGWLILVWRWSGASDSDWELLPTPPFPIRYGHTTSVYNGTIFLTGGADDTVTGTLYQDVWRFDGGQLRESNNRTFG